MSQLCHPIFLHISLVQLGPGQAERVPCPFQQIYSFLLFFSVVPAVISDNSVDLGDELGDASPHCRYSERLQPIRALPERPSLRTQVMLLPWRVSL